MFGDVGHGFILLAVALYLLFKEKELMSKPLNEVLNNLFLFFVLTIRLQLLDMAFHGRYMLLLMALFSIYAGLIYNEFLSVPLNLFGTNWEVDPEGDGRRYRLIDVNRTYPFGVDPVWKVSAAINPFNYYYMIMTNYR